MTPSESLLSVNDLSVAFHQGQRSTLAVDRVSFDIAKGETLALVGESGSGKSVTALSVMKLLPYPAAHHPSGSIRFKGRELLTMTERQIRHVRGKDITIIFQEPMTSLNPLHTIEKQIGEILLLHQGLTGAPARARTLDLLTQVGIPDPQSRLKSYPHQLSGGQRQRVMIAMALANEPDLLIADEPTTALDVTVQAQILALLADIRARLGMSLLFITHDLGIVRRIADVVCVMNSGKTTLGLALLRLISSDGPIVLLGKDIQGLRFKAMRPFRRDMQIVFQDPFGALSPRMSVGDIVAEGISVHQPGLSRDAREARVVKALQDVGLDPATPFREPPEYSGGQHQRI